MEWFLIYLFVMIERIGSLFMFGWGAFWVGVALYLVIVVACSFAADQWNEPRKFKEVYDDKSAKLFRKISKVLISFGLIFGIIGFLLPSQKDAAIIVGSGITYNVLTSETGKRIGGKAVDLLEQKIDEALKAPEKTEEPKKIEGKAL